MFVETDSFRGYGGPAFNWQQYADEFRAGRYRNYKSLYDDVQLELSNLNNQIRRTWKVNYSDLIWFEDSLNPKQYTSNLTVESIWAEDFQDGIDNFQSLIDFLTEIEQEPFDPNDLKGYDRSKMDSVRRVMWDFEFNNLHDNEYDLTWGPYEWQPDAGEWERCRRIALDNEEYPVTVLVNGKMIDGAHRLAVAILKKWPSYPCLVGVPEHWFEEQ